jgi:hypothetical protein
MTIGILSTEFYLIDNWPGEVTNGPNPADWTAISANEVFPLGTKRMIYDDTNSGWAILAFLKFVDGAVPEPDLGAGKFPICGMHTAAAASGDYFCVANDMSIVSPIGPIAIALGTPVTATPYAWFWIGGVCPQDTITELNDAAFVTDGDVTAQSYMVLSSSASYVAFHLGTATDVCNFSAFSLVADTTA